MPLTTTPQPSARERRAALEAERTALAAHLESLRIRRDALPPSAPEWRRIAAEMRSIEGELADYTAAMDAMAPEVIAEFRAAGHAARVAAHGAATEAAERMDHIAGAADRYLSGLLRVVAQYLRCVGPVAEAAGVEPHPYRIGDTLPEMHHLRDVIVARLVVAGILDPEHMPAQFADAPACYNDLRREGLVYSGQELRSPFDLAAAASVLRDVHGGFKRAIANADPERQRRETARLAALDRQRAEREAAEAAKPRKVGPPPPPIVHTVAPAVRGRVA